MTEFVPLEWFRRLFTYWWMVLAFTLLGGLAGWSVHFFQPPVYEAHTELIITMDPIMALSQYDNDLAIGVAGGLSLSDTVITQVVDNAQNQGIDIDAPTIRRTFSVERQNSTWILRVRNSNPEIAALLANLWAKQAYAFFVSAQQNILRAATLGNELMLLQSCLTASAQATPAAADSPVVCGSVSISNFQETQQTILDQINTAQQQVGGFPPYLIFGLGKSAEVPDQPVVYGIAPLTFAGALIGFFMGAGILILRK